MGFKQSKNTSSTEYRFKNINTDIELDNIDIDNTLPANRFKNVNKDIELDNIEVENKDIVQLRFKKNDEDDEKNSMDDEEENEIKLCGERCRKVPGNIRAKFIDTMFADYIRLQTTVSATWNVLSKYNKQGYLGKLECIEVEKNIAEVEAEIITVGAKISKMTADINACRAEEYEEKIRRAMWL